MTSARQASGLQRTSRFSPFVGYGAVRGLVEGLLGARGVALAALLGAEWFGAWSLARIGHQYAALGGIGLIRGLEVEVSACGPEGRERAANFGRATLAWFLVVFGALAIGAGIASGTTPDVRASAVLGGIALGVLAERAWLYAASYMRACGQLSRLGRWELVNASLQLGLCTALACLYGIWGAFIGFLLGHAIALWRLAPDVPLRPRWSWARVKTLARIGFPVSISQFLHTLMISADRLVVGMFLGIEALGLYAFAVAVSSLGAVIGFVLRTVMFPGVFRMARRIGPDASIERLDRALFPLAWLLAPTFGLAALAIAPAIELLLPEYAAAVPAVRLFMFIGIVQALNMVVQLGVLADDRQHRLPFVTGGALLLNLVLALGFVTLGWGLEALAGLALLTRLGHVLVLMLMIGRAAWRERLRVASRLLAPILACAGLVTLLSRLFPTGSARGFGLAVAGYLAGIAVLSPGILHSLRVAAQAESAHAANGD